MKRQYKTIDLFLTKNTVLPRGLKHKLIKNGFRVKDYYTIFSTNNNCLVIQFIDNSQTWENLKKILGDSLGYWFLFGKPEFYFQ